MRTFLLAQVTYGVAALAVFAVWYGLRWRQWWHSTTGRQLMAMAVALVLAFGSLLLPSAGIRVPLGFYAVGFAAFDIMATGWVLLLYQTRTRKKETDRV